MKISNEEIKHIAELGILKTIPDFLTKPLHPGRLKKAFMEVDYLVNKELKIIYSRNPNVYADNKNAIAYYLDAFGKAANWIGNETHVASVVSFCLAFLETSNFSYPDKLFDSLNKIIDYYERAGNIDTEDLINAEGFQNVWETIPEYNEFNDAKMVIIGN
jgi:Asp-tRNA(Asn)/Glu-tRNA(Gln) amidotransferase C subunit